MDNKTERLMTAYTKELETLNLLGRILHGENLLTTAKSFDEIYPVAMAATAGSDEDYADIMLNLQIAGGPLGDRLTELGLKAYLKAVELAATTDDCHQIGDDLLVRRDWIFQDQEVTRETIRSYVEPLYKRLSELEALERAGH